MFIDHKYLKYVGSHNSLRGVGGGVLLYLLLQLSLTSVVYGTSTKAHSRIYGTVVVWKDKDLGWGETSN